MARIDNLSNFLTDVGKAIKAKKGDETPIPAKNFDTEIENMQTGGGIVPRNVKNIQVKFGPTSIGFKWEDPDDTLDHAGSPYCKWKGTRIMYREGNEYPLDESDGTLVLDSTTKNAYKNDYYTISNLKPEQKYTFALFPYSDKDMFNINESNCNILSPTVTSFSDATDDQIAAILDAHYKGIIKISDYWHVGDTRKMHLSAMSSGTGANESHVAQDMTMVIIGIEHDNLKTPINGKTKAAVTLQCKEVLGNNGSAEYGYIWGSSTSTASDSNYSQNPRRTWLNGTFINSLPSGIKSLVKTVVKKNIANHSSSPGAGPDTEDKAFLTSYPEMFGSASYSYYKGSVALEGEQYAYYNSNARRIKYPNSNGLPGSSAYLYWLRSPSSRDSSRWIRVYAGGSASNLASTDDGGLAPAFCL